MKKFGWRLAICLLPLILGALVVANAFRNYYAGQGGFRLGVDLVGGTILIYEVDESKFPDGKLPNDWKPEELARRLKTRIDPNDLYNITVRVASRTRFEIILPTGGAYQVAAENTAWKALLDTVEKEFPVETYLVPAGHDMELLAQLYGQSEDNPSAERPSIQELRDFVDAGMKKYNAAKPADKQKAWDDLLKSAKEKYPPREYEVGRGKYTDLAALVTQQHAKTPLEDINKVIRPEGTSAKKHNRGGMTIEQVLQCKELIAQVGSLEFRIAANPTNDADAIKAAQLYFREGKDNKEIQKRLEEAAIYDKPPPPPLAPTGGNLFDTTRGRFSYSWVEMSSDFRHQYGLANPRDKNGQLINVTDPRQIPASDDYKNYWLVKQARNQHELADITMPGSSARLSGVYSREVRTTRLSEADADKKIEYFVLMRDPETPEKRITGEYLAFARPSMDGAHVDFRFKPAGAELFHELTSRNINQPLGIILDGYVESEANIQSAISTDGQLTGNFTQEKVERTVQVLRSGALPGTLKREPVSENSMGPTLGADTITWGFWSIIGAFIAVLVFMVFYYFFAGFVACVALFANLLLTVACMVMIDAAFTLPGLAGLVLTLGMAVDANVLIYERIREERKRHVDLKRAIQNGYDRALPTIIDTHLSSIFTAIVLYVVGNDQLKGFGISLTLGLLISLFTSLFMTRLLFDLWQDRGWLTKLTMPFDPFSGFHFDFMKWRWVFFTLTVGLTVLGGWLFISRLDSGGLNIDFVGGTAYGAELVKPVTIEQLRDALTHPLDLAQIREALTNPVSSDYVRRTLLKDDESLVQLRAAATEATDLEQLRQKLGTGNLPTLERLQADLSLPDLSVEQLFISAPGYTDGRASKLFTLRTSEKNVALVSADITRRIGGTEGDVRLKKILIGTIEYLPDNKTIALAFVDADAQGKPDLNKPVFASRAQVSTELTKVLAAQTTKLEDEAKKAAGDAEKTKLDARLKALRTMAQQFKVEGLGKDEEGRFQFMEIQFVDTIGPDEKPLVEAAVATMRQAFQDNPIPERLENFDSQLAQETQVRALYAIIASWGAILLYLWFRFGNWTFGLAAVLCLIHDLFFTLGAIAACHYVFATSVGQALLLQDFKIDLPSVAALLTLVGYSVNDTIVVFDRIREVRGKNPALTEQMINDSVNQTLSRTILASLTTFLVVFVLFVMGGEGVHLFAFVMVVGVVVGTYSSIYIAAPLLLMFGEGRVTGAERQPTPTPVVKNA